MESQLDIQYQGDSQISNSIWINLMQKDPPIYDGNISLSDLLNMDAAARAGITAFGYRFEDGVYFSDNGNVIHIPLSFYVFPNSMSLPYSLEVVGEGTLSEQKVVNTPITQNIIIPMANSVSLKAIISNANFSWEIPCYNDKGIIVPNPTYEITQNNILLSDTVFSVLRGSCNYTGYEYTVTLSFRKSETTQENPISNIIINQTTYDKITNAESSIICTFLDENEEEQQELLELKLPQAVQNYLAECPDGSRIVDPPDGKDCCHTTYYYSTCTGKIIDTNRTGSCDLFGEEE